MDERSGDFERVVQDGGDENLDESAGGRRAIPALTNDAGLFAVAACVARPASTEADLIGQLVPRAFEDGARGDGDRPKPGFARPEECIAFERRDIEAIGDGECD